MGFGIEGKLKMVIHPSFLSYLNLLPLPLLPSNVGSGENAEEYCDLTSLASGHSACRR